MTLAVLAVLVSNAFPSGGDPCTRLLTEVAGEDWHGIEAAALDAAPDCVPELAAHLADRGDTPYAAAYALALLSDAQAQDALFARLAPAETPG